jgi:predicted ribosome quality control (RQC) complex YloA/Tae2 family protein
MENAEQYRLAGDLILANLEKLQPGMAEADLTAHDGTRCVVILDPKRSVQAVPTLQKYKSESRTENLASRLLQAG